MLQFIAQTTQNTAVEALQTAQQANDAVKDIWADVKLAFAGMLALVIGALGLAVVALIRKGGAYFEAKLEAKAATKTANEAKVDAAVAKSTAFSANIDAKANTQNIAALANQVTSTSAPTGPGGISGTGAGGMIPQ